MTRKILIALALLCPSLALAQDAGIGMLPEQEYTLCDAGMSAAGACSDVFTNLSTTLTAVAPAQAQFLELAPFHQVSVSIQMNVAVVTGDVTVQCDTDSAFGSPTLLLQHSIGTGTASQDTGWYDIAVGGECSTAAGVWVRAGLDEGNGSEDPRIAFARLHVR